MRRKSSSALAFCGLDDSAPSGRSVAITTSSSGLALSPPGDVTLTSKSDRPPPPRSVSDRSCTLPLSDTSSTATARPLVSLTVPDSVSPSFSANESRWTSGASSGAVAAERAKSTAEHCAGVTCRSPIFASNPWSRRNASSSTWTGGIAAEYASIDTASLLTASGTAKKQSPPSKRAT